jgi:hypothetical protein
VLNRKERMLFNSKVEELNLLFKKTNEYWERRIRRNAQEDEIMWHDHENTERLMVCKFPEKIIAKQ